jgi:hypothetical protein
MIFQDSSLLNSQKKKRSLPFLNNCLNIKYQKDLLIFSKPFLEAQKNKKQAFSPVPFITYYETCPNKI